MILLLATEGSQGSLGLYKNIVIDTLPPYVLDVASGKRNGEKNEKLAEIICLVYFTRPQYTVKAALRSRN